MLHADPLQHGVCTRGPGRLVYKTRIKPNPVTLLDDIPAVAAVRRHCASPHHQIERMPDVDYA